MSRLAEETGISAGAVWTIIHEKLDMSEGQCKMGPKNDESFSEGHSLPVLSRELENLKLLTEDLEHFFQRLVTGDETWVYHRDPESMQWKHKTSPTPKKFRV